MPNIARSAVNTLSDRNLRILVHDVTGPAGQLWTDLQGKPLRLIYNMSQDQQVLWRGEVDTQGWISIPLGAFDSADRPVLRIGQPLQVPAVDQSMLPSPEADFAWCEQYEIEPLVEPSSRDDIKSIQVALNQLGYCAGRIDGVVGPIAASALMQFQQDSGLPITGRPDADTSKRLLQEAAKLETTI